MATYYVAEGGTAANKAAATSGTYPTGCMSVTVHNGETFAAADRVLLSDEGGVIRVQIIPPTAGVTYDNKSGDTPEVSGADVCTFNQSTLPDLWDEGFEAVGYDETWDQGETISSVASTLDEDADTAEVSSPYGWGSKCLKMVVVANENCYVQDYSLNAAVSFSRVEFIVSAHTMAATTNIGIFRTTRGGGSVLFEGELYYDGALKFRMNTKHDRNNNYSTPVAISTGALYRVEMKWDSTNDVYEWKLNGVTQESGVLTGDAANDTTNGMRLGRGTKNQTQTIYYDRVAMSSTGWVGEGTAAAWFSDSLSADPHQVFDDDVRLTEETVFGNLGAGEWYWDGTANQLWVGSDPSGSVIEASVREHCFQIDQSDITLEGSITCEKARGENIDFFTPGKTGLTISDIESHRSWLAGIRAATPLAGDTPIENILIQDVTVSQTGGAGIYCNRNIEGCLIQRAHVSNAAVFYNSGFAGGQQDWVGGITSKGAGANGVIVEECLVDGALTSFGIWMDATGDGGTDAPIVRNNFVDGCIYDGIRIESHTEDALVIGNVSINNGWAGIHVAANTDIIDGNMIFNNTCTKNVWGIRCSGGDEAGDVINNIFKNNISSGNTSKELYCATGGENGDYGSGNVYESNCFGAEAEAFIQWGTTGGDNGDGTYDTYDTWLTASSQTDNNREADPLLTDPDSGDCTLGVGSPCIDTGADLGADYDDALLPASTWPSNVTTGDQDDYGVGWNIGAYLYGTINIVSTSYKNRTCRLLHLIMRG